MPPQGTLVSVEVFVGLVGFVCPKTSSFSLLNRVGYMNSEIRSRPSGVRSPVMVKPGKLRNAPRDDRPFCEKLLRATRKRAIERTCVAAL